MGQQEKSMGFVIGATRRLILKELNAALLQRQVPVTIEQFIFLNSLQHLEGPVSQQDVSKFLCKDKSGVLRILNNLEQKGLVERYDDVSDGRKKLVRLTPESIEILRQVNEIEQETSERLRKGICEADYQAMLRVMQQIQNNITS
jgi:MarR family transcriptional regulator, transcriptional regulator for hemolysin